MNRLSVFVLAGLLSGVLLFLLAACGEQAPPPTEPPPAAIPGPDIAQVKGDVVANYAEGVHALYAKSLASATIMDQAIGLFLDDPTPSSLEGAKRAWLRARDDYGPTEAFRFYGGPIDNEEDGPRGPA